MHLAPPQKLMLYALGQFYQSLNQPLVEKPLRVSTSKIVFIELLLKSKIISKQARAVYKNMEALQKKKLIAYEKRMIRFTDKGLREAEQINQELQQYLELKQYFQKAKSKRKLQTIISS